MTPEPPMSLHAKGDVAAQLAALRQEQLSVFEDDSLAWLAMTPAWTERLAQASHFPTGKWSLPDFLTETEQLRLAQRGPPVAKQDLDLRRTRGLMALWPSLDTGQRRRAAPLLQQGVPAVTDRIERLRIQITLAPFDSSGTDGQLPPQLANLLEAIDAQSARSKALLIAQLVSVVPSSAVLDKALAIVRAMSDPEAACRLLAIVIAAFPEHADLAELGRNLATEIEDLETRAHTLLLLATALARSGTASALHEQALASIIQIPSRQERTDALAAALPMLAPPVLELAVDFLFALIPTIANPVHRAQVLEVLAPHVRKDEAGAFTGILVETAGHANEIRDSAERDSALAMIAVAHGLTGDAATAQAVAQTIVAPIKRSITLLQIASAQPKSSAAAMTENVVKSWHGLQTSVLEPLYLGVPQGCAKYLPRTVVSSIAYLIDAMVADRRFEPAIRLLDLLGAKTAVAQRILNAVLDIGNETERNAALMQLAPRIPKPLLEEAVANLAKVTPPDRLFWMPDASRQDVIQYLRERPTTGLLQMAASRAGQAVLRAVENERLDVTPATFRWAQIAAQCSNLTLAADFVNDKVYAAVEVGDLGDALEYAKATTELANSLGQQLELAVAQIQHRIGLAYRRASDERHLTRFLPRKEYSDAIAGLLAHSTPHWAMHFLGAGGVGKTMLMRELTARLAVKDGKRLPTSRVDFDHINPEFPVRKPGELLAVLAEELRIYGGADQEDRHRKFQGDLTEFHGALNAEPPSEDPLKNIGTPAFERLLHSFAALLHGLPKPVILVLDTCEELAKLDPVGSSLPSVEATLRIIERVHELEPGIRVVFAGRRLLARSGGILPGNEKKYAWAARNEALAEVNRILPEAKDYLQLHVMRGFSAAEADDYFSRIIGVVLEPAQREAILRRSQDPGIPFEIHLAEPAPRDDTRQRYNPFDLSLYADWVKEDPTVSAEVLGSGEADPYVEMRIMRRIGSDALRHAIPYAVLLRRFDMEMLRPAAVAVGYDVARLFRDLGAEEWMEYQQDALQVDTKFLPRLQHYFKHEVRRHLLAGASARLAPELVALVRKFLAAEDPFVSLRGWHIDAALRLANEADAAELWSTIDRAITDSGNWNWAATVCRVMLSSENVAGDETSWLHAAVRATHNAALVHTQPGNQAIIREAWSGIAELSQRHPIVTVGAFIAMRSRLWTHPLDSALVSETLQFEGDDWQREQLAAALAAAMERELEKPDAAVIDLAVKNSALEAFSPEVKAGLACSLARFSRKRGRLRTAKRLAARLDSRKTAQRWADWRRPASLAARIRLELLCLDPSSADRDELEAWARKADIATIDGERLLSRTLTLRLEYEPVAPPPLEPAQIYDSGRRPECRAHRETPPLIAPFVDAMISQNLDRRSFELVSDARARALEKQDAATVQAADAIKLKLDRRLRTADAMQALASLIATQHPGSSPFHQKWAVRVPGDVAALNEQLGRQRDDSTSVGYVRPDGSPDLHYFLDFYEGELLAEQDGTPPETLLFPVESARVERRNGGQTIGPQLEYRLAALTKTRRPDLAAADKEKPRRLAEIALEEGELLALRLPGRAIWLFEEAHRHFTRANDPLGQSLAAISAAMASCRVGDRARAAEWLERAGAEFQVRNPPEGDSANSWVLRAAACVAWIHERDDEGPLSTWVSHAIARRYGSVIPPELAFASVAPTPVAVPSAIKNFIYLLVGLVTSLGLAALVVWTMFGANRRWFDAVTDFASGFMIAVVTIAIISFELFLLWLFWRAVRGWFARLAFYVRRQSIMINPNRDGSVFLLAGFESFTTFALPAWPAISLVARMFGLGRKEYAFRITQPDFKSYSKNEQPTSWFRNQNNRFVRTLSADRVSFLFVNPSVAHYPWEAIIGLRAWQGWRPILAGFGQLVRTADELPKEPRGIAEWSSGSILVVSRSGLATEAWKDTSGVDTRAVTTLTAAPAALRVLHLIGRARRGASGAVFSTGGQGNNLSELVNINKLPLSNAAIVVIQEEPAERVRRLDVDREQAADARDWAAQVFRAGAHTVVFIPAMPFALAKQSISALASKLDSTSPPSIWRLAQAARAARAVVTQFKGDRGGSRATILRQRNDATRANDLRELALEITLFTRFSFDR